MIVIKNLSKTYEKTKKDVDKRSSRWGIKNGLSRFFNWLKFYKKSLKYEV